jgi:hypothetical protein
MNKQDPLLSRALHTSMVTIRFCKIPQACKAGIAWFSFQPVHLSLDSDICTANRGYRLTSFAPPYGVDPFVSPGTTEP